MKVRLNRTEIPYKITKASIQDNAELEIPILGSMNKSAGKGKSKKTSNKKIYQAFMLQYLTSFGLLTNGGLCVFAKRTGDSNKDKYFTVEVLSPPGKKITYTLDGVSDSAIGIAIRLTKLGANSFYYSVPFNKKSLPKKYQDSIRANTILSYHNMLCSCGVVLKAIVTVYKDEKNPDFETGILLSKDGVISVIAPGIRFRGKTKKKSLEWLLKYIRSYDFPTIAVFGGKEIKKLLPIAKKSELSSMPTFKIAAWRGKDRHNSFSKAFERQKTY